MAHYYADSSALVKRHVTETGSAWFTALAYPTAHMVSAVFARSGMQAAGASPLIFLSADGRLLIAAQAEGFVTDNPNLH